MPSGPPYKRVKKRLVFPKVKIETKKPWLIAEEQEAKVWAGRVRTAERLDIVSSPVNRQALSGTKRAPRNGQTGRRRRSPTRVYVVKFVLLADARLVFLKIGVTSTDVMTRFAADDGRYRVTIVHEGLAPSRRHALVLESALHAVFKPMKFRPPAPLLSGGNSECFAFSEDLERHMKQMIDEWLLASPVNASPSAGVAQR